MNIPDEYVIPGLGMVATTISGILVWFINQNKQRIDSVEKDIKDIQEKADLHEIAIHESRVRRQSDVDIMSVLTRNMEKLSEKLHEVHLELQNKQTRL
jgi:predicted Co/Zn/Cd cation transporter (cation efflux family)